MRTLVILLLSFLSISMIGQINYVMELDKLIEGEEIDYKLISENFNIDTIHKRDIGTTFSLKTKYVNQDKDNIILLIDEHNGVGAMAYLYSFSKNGDVKDKMQVMDAWDNDDLEAADYDYFYEVIGNKVKIEHRSDEPIVLPSGEKSRKIETRIVYIPLESHGYFFEFSRDDYDNNMRMFPETSDRLLMKQELEKLTKDELAIMRNEIFATHGYKFKSKLFRSYFDSKDWYKASLDNVDLKLTEIENKNIELIKSIEDLR